MLDDAKFNEALKNAKNAREIFFLVRNSVPAEIRKRTDEHANQIIGHYMKHGDAGKAQLLYIALKTLAMQEDGLL